MTCDFTSFSTIFQSYQDDVRMIMKGCVQWNSVYGWEDFTSSEDRTRSARSVGQRLTHWATGAPGLTEVYAQSLSADCDLDLWPSNMVLVCNTYSCHDDRLCQIVFKSYHVRLSYGLDTILEHTTTHWQGKLYAFPPIHDGDIKTLR